jgi:hydroxymethylpyrimidine/phosphomethylpyrimidine kinase
MLSLGASSRLSREAEEHRLEKTVVDPVMVAKSGAAFSIPERSRLLRAILPRASS